MTQISLRHPEIVRIFNSAVLFPPQEGELRFGYQDGDEDEREAKHHATRQNFRAQKHTEEGPGESGRDGLLIQCRT